MKKISYIIICSILFTNLLFPPKAFCADNDSVHIQLSDLKEVVTYTKAIEAENTALKNSLQTERESAQKVIDSYEEQKDLYNKQIQLLNNEIALEKQQTAKAKRTKNTLTYIIGALAISTLILAVK